MTNTPQPRILVCAAEHSADMHAAAVLAAVKKRFPNATCTGLGGPLLAQAGCELMANIEDNAAMLTGVIGRIPWGYRILREFTRILNSGTIDLFLPVDSPVLNVPIARRAHKAQVKTLYYIAPQVWAWGRSRVSKIRRCVDMLAVIWPFEEEFFNAYGIPARFVGHPLIERIQQAPVDSRIEASFVKLGQPRLLLLPGSRRQVVHQVLPGQIAVAKAVLSQYPQAAILLASANDTVRQMAASMLAEHNLPATIETGRNAEMIRAADLVLVASGTATIEVACHAKPMVVMYNSSRTLYNLVGKHLIHTRHLSMVNILANRELVPEFMPYYRSPAQIAATTLDLLASPGRRRQIKDSLTELINTLHTPQPASEMTADAIEHVLGWPGTPSAAYNTSR